jgi:hypothetical protein
MVNRDKLAEKKLARKVKASQDDAEAAIEGVDSTKARVAEHMKRTIDREKQMQALRAKGITKMATYAKGVLTRLQAILSTDDKQNEELKDEINQLSEEVMDMQDRDTREQNAEKAEEGEIDAIKEGSRRCQRS